MSTKELLDAVAVAAHEAAETKLKADRGTHVHALTDAVDRGEPIAPLVPAGEALGIPAPLQARITEQWTAHRQALGVRALAIELPIVNDRWQIAGTADRLDEATRMIHTPFGVIREGQALIGDTKTGALTETEYWVKYPVQVCGYRDGVPYDTETDTRLEWAHGSEPHPVVALIYHYDLAAALEGEMVEWQTIPINLSAGREAGDACMAAKEAAKLAIAAIGEPLKVAAVPSSPSPEVEQQQPAGAGPVTAPAGNIAANLRRRVERIKDSPDAIKALSMRWPADVPTFKSDHDHTDAELAQIAAAIDRVETDHSLPFDPPPSEPTEPANVEPAPPQAPQIDEGDPISDADYELFGKAFNDLDNDDKQTMAGIAQQAKAAGYPISVTQKRTERRFQIATALIAWCRAGWDEPSVRAGLVLATGDQSFEQPGVDLGTAIGALTISEARSFGDVARQLANGALTVDITTDGTRLIAA